MGTDLPQPSSPASSRSPFPTPASSRAPQLFASLAATWSARSSRSPAELHANLTSTLRSILAMSKRIPDSTLHQYESIAIEALQMAVAEVGPQSGVVVPASPDAVAAPVAPTSASLALPPHMQHLFLRLLGLQLTRLPAYYRKLGSTFEERNEVLPPALSVPAYLSFVDRAHAVCGAMLNKQLPVLNSAPTPASPWAELLAPLAFHLQLMSFPPDAAAFSQRAVVDLFEGSAGFVRALWKYHACEDVFVRLVALMEGAPSEHTEWIRRMTLSAIRAWRSADPTNAPGRAPSLNEPHDSSFVVRSTPPSIQQHSVLMNLSLLVTGSLRTYDRKHPGTEEQSPQSSLFVREMLAECKSMFKLFTTNAIRPATSASPPSSTSENPASPFRHRSLLPLFALLGIAQSLEDVEVPADDDAGDSLLLVRSLRSEIRSMVGAILRLPEVLAMAQGERGGPCVNALGVACPSCCFVWIASVAIVHATQRDVSLITLNSAPPGPLLLRACWITLRAFLQILDVSWLLHGAIQPDTKEPATPPPTPAEVTDAPAAASASSAEPAAVPKLPARKSFPLDTSRLLQLNGWLRSAFYLLLPHYSRSLGILLIALDDRRTQTAVLSALWQRVKYIHLVWRWYAAQESTAPRKPGAEDRSTPQAQKRLKRIATMQPVQPTENLFATVASSSPASSVPLKIVPIRLPALLLNRAHSTLAMSVFSVLARLANSPDWAEPLPANRPYLGSPDDEAPELDLNYSALERSQRKEEKRGTVDSVAASERSDRDRHGAHSRTLHAFQVALILDVMGLLDFARPPNFAPFEQLLKVVSALSCGEPVPRGELAAKEQLTADMQWLQQAHEIEAAHIRRVFGRTVLEIFVRCFLCPDINDPDPSAAAINSMSHGEKLPPFLGMEQQIEIVELNCKRFADPNKSRATLDSIGAMLGQSGVPFAPSSPALAVPNPLSTPWPALCRMLPLRPTSSFMPQELGWASRNFFLAGVFRTALGVSRKRRPAGDASSQSSIPFEIVFHYLLPWSFSLLQHPQPDLNARIQDLFAEIWRSGYLRATRPSATMEDTVAASSKEVDSSLQLFLASVSIAPLPPAPSGSSLELFLRSVLPFWLPTVLQLYPKVLPNRAVVDVFVSVCSTLPATDLTLLAALEMVRTRAAQMIAALLRNERTMKSWRAVMDGIEQGTEKEEDGVPVYAPPPGVPVPADFPRDSFAKVRSLLLLYCHLMQSLDGALFPLALAGLDDLLVRSLCPTVHPLCTPLRASVASLIHAALVHSFDLTKREQAVAWYIAAVQRLNIPIGIKQPEVTVITQADRKKSVMQRFEEISQRVEERAAAAQVGPFRTDR